MKVDRAQPTDRRRWLLVAALVLGAAIAGFGVGTWRSGVSVHDAMAQSAEGAISADADGWTYGIPIDVVWWDADGSMHDGDRPDCLPPTGIVGPIRFGSVDVSANGASWRQVVWVSCGSR